MMRFELRYIEEVEARLPTGTTTKTLPARFGTLAPDSETWYIRHDLCRSDFVVRGNDQVV
ncbi:MAG TPA: hypothetical protein VGZ29_12620 [Terriglobia bacterium]|nr:hypothetical protein [Terriglobia bacterium]